MMELELGLGLPNHSPMMIKEQEQEQELDLNSADINEVEMERNQKRGFVEVENKLQVQGGLSLFLWTGQPQDDNDGPPQKWRKFHHDLDLQTTSNDEENDEELEGWPPINSLRKELLLQHQDEGDLIMNNHHQQQQQQQAIAVRTFMYVKVKMEGVGIGRKIDLSLYDSYQALTNALINMFAKYNSSMDMSQLSDYKILYQDKEGDWMLVGDVPWQMFIESVQRMVILKNSNR